MNPFAQLTGDHKIPESAKPRSLPLMAGLDDDEAPAASFEPLKPKNPGRTGRKPTLTAGTEVGHWTLLEYRPGQSGPDRYDNAWLCRCSCGQERWVRAKNLTSARSTSCGHVVYRWSTL